MADKNKNEYRIQITPELSAGFNQAINNIDSPEVDGVELDSSALPSRLETPRSAWLDALNAGFLIDSTKKVLSATGNTEASMAIEIGVKFGTAFAGLAQGNPGAFLGLAMDIVAEGLMKIQEAKAEAIENNQTKVNNLRIGKTLLGAGRINASKDLFGNISYNKN